MCLFVGSLSIHVLTTIFDVFIGDVGGISFPNLDTSSFLVPVGLCVTGQPNVRLWFESNDLSALNIQHNYLSPSQIVD